MTISRRQTLVMGVVVLVLMLAAGVLWWHRRRALANAATPAWSDPGQPPDTVGMPSAGASWAANRCGPMVGPCGGYSAGGHVMRHYPSSLAADPNSIIRGALELQMRVGLN